MMENNEELIKKDPKIKEDRLRFTKNRIPSWLCYLAIVFDVIYFIGVYKINHEYFYTGMIAISVLTNLVFMLGVFLSSEEVKSYKFSYSIVMLVFAVIQIVRIFIYPYNAYLTEGKDGAYVIEMPTFMFLAAMLACSAVSLIVGGIIGILKSRKYKKAMADATAVK